MLMAAGLLVVAAAIATALARRDRVPGASPTPSGSSPTPSGSSSPTIARRTDPFLTLPVGAALPSAEQCAAWVGTGGVEHRPQNTKANTTSVVAGTDYTLVPWNERGFGMDPAAGALRSRIDGDFRGTTAEILRWGACKWGFDEEIVRAIAATESSWLQSFRGDPVDSADGIDHTSYGLLQVKRTEHLDTYPAIEKSSAFNVDYALAYRRACFEGYLRWLARIQPGYGAGDEWGCVGHWFSGGWFDDGAKAYIGRVEVKLAAKPWLTGKL